MKNRTTSKSEEKKPRTEREPYEAPAIIYEGLITTASGGGSNGPPPPQSGPTGGGADPANIFGSG